MLILLDIRHIQVGIFHKTRISCEYDPHTKWDPPAAAAAAAAVAVAVGGGGGGGGGNMVLLLLLSRSSWSWSLNGYGSKIGCQ